MLFGAGFSNFGTSGALLACGGGLGSETVSGTATTAGFKFASGFTSGSCSGVTRPDFGWDNGATTSGMLAVLAAAAGFESIGSILACVGGGFGASGTSTGVVPRTVIFGASGGLRVGGIALTGEGGGSVFGAATTAGFDSGFASLDFSGGLLAVFAEGGSEIFEASSAFGVIAGLLLEGSIFADGNGCARGFGTGSGGVSRTATFGTGASTFGTAGGLLAGGASLVGGGKGSGFGIATTAGLGSGLASLIFAGGTSAEIGDGGDGGSTGMRAVFGGGTSIPGTTEGLPAGGVGLAGADEDCGFGTATTAGFCEGFASLLFAGDATTAFGAGDDGTSGCNAPIFGAVSRKGIAGRTGIGAGGGAGNAGAAALLRGWIEITGGAGCGRMGLLPGGLAGIRDDTASRGLDCGGMSELVAGRRRSEPVVACSGATFGRVVGDAGIKELTASFRGGSSARTAGAQCASKQMAVDRTHAVMVERNMG